MEVGIVIAYGLCLLFIFLFSLGQLHLTVQYLKSKKQIPVQPKPLQSVNFVSKKVFASEIAEIPDDSLQDMSVCPAVTIQLPLYNEMYVVERLIDTIAMIDYPKEKLEIQVLDDSTDQTVEIVARKVTVLRQQGLDIKHIRRNNRQGFKAGALEEGLTKAKGEFIAIFDADFLPNSDFLLQTIPWFEDTNIGVVQTRWGHLNRDYSLLTRLQAFGLDGHFTVEQGGRSQAGSFINFNGTGGVWRKSCIIDAGGWSADTLTEDLDLSYRAQMRGWYFKYLENVYVPAELPVFMDAIKLQQFRWNKGAAECARKHLKNILTNSASSRKFSLVNKVHAFLHLFNSSIFLFLLLAALLSIPMLFIKEAHPELDRLFKAGGIFLIGFLSIGFFYWIAARQISPHNSLRYYITTYPLFLIVTMGLSLFNTIAVAEGLLGVKTPFTRTPKFNIKSAHDKWNKNIYINQKISPVVVLELVLALYFIFGIYFGIRTGNFELIIFHIMLTIGFLAVAFFSIFQAGGLRFSKPTT